MLVKELTSLNVVLGLGLHVAKERGFGRSSSFYSWKEECAD